MNLLGSRSPGGRGGRAVDLGTLAFLQAGRGGLAQWPVAGRWGPGRRGAAAPGLEGAGSSTGVSSQDITQPLCAW